MQMRAGIEQPHPHALLHLILDARDRSFDHHAELNHEASHESSPGPHAGDHESAPPDLPAFGDTIVVSGGLAITAVLLTVLALSPSRARSDWPRPGGWMDHLTALEPPPPRFGLIFR
jgi:hypothetical protein